jgi:hypothetical protein
MYPLRLLEKEYLLELIVLNEELPNMKVPSLASGFVSDLTNSVSGTCPPIIYTMSLR